MTTYVMQAKENYDPTRAAQADAGTFTAGTFVDPHYLSLGYDAVNRELVYQAIIMQPITSGPVTGTNTTGHDLWDGATAIVSGATFDASENFNFQIARKNIDTGAVTFYDVYDSTATVPALIYGDGTARRYVSDTTTVSQYPCLSDPRTHDAWAHMESCQLYVFREADDYGLRISPLRPTGGVDNPVLPIGMETDWVYATEYYPFPSGPTGTSNLYLIPRLTTAAETTADVLLAYATYTLPYTAGGSGGPQQQFRTAVDNDGGFWALSMNVRGSSPGVKLHKFTKPSAFVYPTPPSDGGFTDETPWLAGTGPNALYAGVSNLLANIKFRLGITFSPGREQLNLVYAKMSNDTGSTAGAIGYTWYNTSDGTWGSSVLGSGYMTAGWVNTDGDPTAAAFYVSGIYQQTNLYLDADNFYDDGDYAYRWIFVQVTPVVGGVQTGDDKFVLLKLTWNTGAAPTISTVLPEDGWDSAYAAYGATIGSPAVVRNSIDQDAMDFFLGLDTGLYDPTTNAFWWSGMTSEDGSGDNMFNLDAAFVGRLSATGPASTFAQPPLLRLSVSEPSRAYSQGHVF